MSALLTRARSAGAPASPGGRHDRQDRTGHRGAGRLARLAAAVVLVVPAVAVGVSAGPAQAATTTYRDWAYPSAATKATADKPQSKLWIAGGSWYGLMIPQGGSGYNIHKLDTATHTWVDQGVKLDDRTASTADALFDGGKLYVVSRGSGGIRFYRLAYANGVWTKEANAVSVATVNPESVTIDRDTGGGLWATWTSSKKVYYASSTASSSGASWSTPAVISPTNVASDDISGIIAFGSNIGIMYSDQAGAALNFAWRPAASNQWTQETVFAGANLPDDHINLKAFQADAFGNVYAAVKTSLEDVAGISQQADLIRVVKRTPNATGTGATWTSVTGGTVEGKLTRPQLVIDTSASRLYLLMTAPTSGGTIYRKYSALPTTRTGALDFTRTYTDRVRGDVFIKYTGAKINDVSTTKQPVTSSTGLVAIAADDTSFRYYHAEQDVPAGGTTPTAPAAPTGLAATASGSDVNLTWTGSSGATSYRVYRNGATTPTATTTTASYTDAGLAAGSYSYTVSAVNAAGESGTSAPASATVAAAPAPSGPVTFRGASDAKTTLATASTLTVGKPAGVQVGDLLVASVVSRGNTAPKAVGGGWTTATAPAGAVTNSLVQSVFTKIATSSEPASYGFTVSREAVGQILAYSGATDAVTMGVLGSKDSSTKLSLLKSATDLTAAAPGLAVTLFSVNNSSSVITIPTGTTQRVQTLNTVGSSLKVATVDASVPAGAVPQYTATASPAAVYLATTLVLRGS